MTNVIVIDVDKSVVQKATQDGVEAYYVNHQSEHFLEELAIQQEVYAFFCVSENSHLNLYMTLSARGISPHIKIITLITSAHDHDKMILAGANKTINHYELSGMRAYRMLHKPNVHELLDSFFFSTEDVGLVEATITKNSKLDGMYLFDVKLKGNYDIIIVGIHDLELSNDFYFNAHTRNHKIDANDILVILGKNDEITRFLKAYN